MTRFALSSLWRTSVAIGLGASLAACGTAASTRTSPVRPAAPAQRLTVSPSTGTPTTVFGLHFTVPVASGASAGSRRSFELAVTGPRRADCVGARAVPVPAAGTGTTVEIPLDPAKLGGRWCAGSYKAQVNEVQRPACSPGMMCPEFLRVLGTVGRVTFRVVSAA
jgi:hypothetical protein